MALLFFCDLFIFFIFIFFHFYLRWTNLLFNKILWTTQLKGSWTQRLYLQLVQWRLHVVYTLDMWSMTCLEITSDKSEACSYSSDTKYSFFGQNFNIPHGPIVGSLTFIEFCWLQWSLSLSWFKLVDQNCDVTDLWAVTNVICFFFETLVFYITNINLSCLLRFCFCFPVSVLLSLLNKKLSTPV